MLIRDARGREHYLSYEMNVHPGETLEHLYHSLDHSVTRVRAALQPSERVTAFAIAPRIGTSLLQALHDPSSRERLCDLLCRQRWIPHTVNAFPLGDFHADRVKEQVYAPSWAQPERLQTTLAIADLLQQLIHAVGIDVEGTISTLGGSYRGWDTSDKTLDAIATHYLQATAHLVHIHRSAGIKLRLTVEPEPDTTFECAADVIALFEQRMLPRLEREFAAPLGVDLSEGERLLRDHFNVNLDVCHQSVLFRDPIEEWKALEARGLRVGKLHITSALCATNIAAQRQELMAFHEPRYLHQFALRRRGQANIERGRDLPALAEESLDDVEEVRCHFHVPLSARRMGTLTTTREDTAQALRHALDHDDPPQLVIETYTWPLLVAAGHSIEEGIVEEFRWVLETGKLTS